MASVGEFMTSEVLKIGQITTIRRDLHAVEHTALVLDGLTQRALSFRVECDTLSLDEIEAQPEAFVLALLMPCMATGQNLVCEAPVDGQLLYNLNTQLVPFLCSRYSSLKPVKIMAPTKSFVHPDVAIGRHVLAMSCGLDALTAYAELSGPDSPPALQPEALLFNDIGAFGRGEAKQAHDLELVERFAKDRALPLVRLTSNMGEFGGPAYPNAYSCRGAAAAWALKGGVARKVTYASGTDYVHMGCLDQMADMGAFDPITFPMMSNSGLEIYSSGFRHTRSSKFELLLTHPELMGYLNTCLRSVDRKGGFINCGQCKKCSELLFRAEAMGCLDALAPSFNVEAFKKTRWFLAEKLVYNAYKPSPSDNSIDTLDSIARHGGRVGVSGRVLGLIAAGTKRGVSRAKRLVGVVR